MVSLTLFTVDDLAYFSIQSQRRCPCCRAWTHVLRLLGPAPELDAGEVSFLPHLAPGELPRRLESWLRDHHAFWRPARHHHFLASHCGSCGQLLADTFIYQDLGDLKGSPLGSLFHGWDERGNPILLDQCPASLLRPLADKAVR